MIYMYVLHTARAMTLISHIPPRSGAMRLHAAPQKYYLRQTPKMQPPSELLSATYLPQCGWLVVHFDEDEHYEIYIA